jgi:hypothetical protein
MQRGFKLGPPRSDRFLEAIADMKDTTRASSNDTQLDPLYVIFEQHLFNFDDSDFDRKTFIRGIVGEYLTYLRKLSIIIPKSLEDPIVEELASQVNTMLVKKIYGCLSVDDYQKNIGTVSKKRAGERYKKLRKVKPKKTLSKAG